MMNLNQLYERARNQHIEIDEMHTRELMASSYPEGWVLMDPSKYESRRRYKCDLAHEVAHCETGSFYNDCSPYDIKARCEHKANKRAIQMLMPFSEVMAALRSGHVCTWSLAEYFDVTEDFAAMALNLYADRIRAEQRKTEVLS